MGVELREITAENFDEAVGLKVAKGQESYVAPNVKSIAQSKFFPLLRTDGVYDGETMVGFVMYGLDAEKEQHFLVRLMIDEQQQRKGYGRSATLAVIERLRKEDDCGAVYLCFVEGNTGAEKLYESIGFQRTGEKEDGEVVMKYGFGKPGVMDS